MRVMILGDGWDDFGEQVVAAGLELVGERPDVVLTYGGDGTFIGSERMFPGVPKLGFRRRETTVKCPAHQDALMLERLAAGDLVEASLLKLEAVFQGRVVTAVNDVILRNRDPRTALRFRIHVNEPVVTEELIADGVVVCTPFGSSAYFRSITRTVIRTGIGVAINNCTDLLHHLVIAEDEEVRVSITRGPAVLAADNDPKMYDLASDHDVIVRRSSSPFRVLSLDSLRCPECRYVHAPRRRF